MSSTKSSVLSSEFLNSSLASTKNGVARSFNGTAKITDVIASFRPTKLFRRGAPEAPTSILSLDFDDSGELLMTSESDESIQIYNVKEGRHTKALLSKKYGVKLAVFSHISSCIVYASTKENDTIRYLSTHDNNFLRYFVGHEGRVTCLAMHPGADMFASCSEDNTLRIWDVNSPNAVGKMLLSNPFLAAFDPSANVIAVASPAAQSILLYDFRNFDKEPFAHFDIQQYSDEVASALFSKEWNKLEFSNDGKSLLLGTNNHHYLLDAFDGGLRGLLQRDHGGPRRRAPGDHRVDSHGPPTHESSGDACFSPDGRYVLSGSRGENVLIWDTLATASDKVMKPSLELPQKSEAAVVAFNPRYNFLATADKEVVFWAPDPHAG